MLVSEAVDRTYQILWAGDSPSYDTLASGITSSATSATVSGLLGSGALWDTAIVEIDSEIIATGDNTGTTVALNQRGWLESAAAAHDSGAKVFFDPKYYRIQIYNAIADVISSLYDEGLYVRAVDTTGTFSTTTDYTLPEGGLDVLSISVSLAGGLRRKLRYGRHYDVFYDAADEPEVQFMAGANNGNALRVAYMKDFTAPASEASDLTTICGVPSSLAPYIPWAAAGRLLITKEPSRTQIEYVSRLMETQNVPLGAVTSIGQGLIRMFDEKVASSRRRQRQRDGIQIRNKR